MGFGLRLSCRGGVQQHVQRTASLQVVQQCWWWGQLGHFPQEYTLTEVRQVFCVAEGSTPSLSPWDVQRSGKMLGGMDYGGYSGYSRQAMMDLGSMQTLVHQTLVWPRTLLKAEWVRFMYGEIHETNIRAKASCEVCT